MFQGGDVVGEQHIFIAKQFVLVFVFQRQGTDAPEQVLHEVSRADAGVKHDHALVGKRRAELGFEQRVHTFHHEVDNRLGRVNNALRVGGLFGKVLKKPLVQGVQKGLLLLPPRRFFGLAFNGEIVLVQRLREIASVETAAHHNRNRFFHLLRDNIAAHKVGVIKNGAKKPFGQKVLRQHFHDHTGRNVWVKRFHTQLVQTIESIGEPGIFVAFFVDTVNKASRKGRDNLTKTPHCVVKTGWVRLLPCQKRLEKGNGLRCIALNRHHGYAAGFGTIRLFACLQHNVGERVALALFLDDFGF